ncbi:MAG: rhodanese-like domain-containing protein [Planctomycetota bacterium]|nr:rhodanese-like domain-containing protein [Planctomycetota bacterium]
MRGVEISAEATRDLLVKDAGSVLLIDCRTAREHAVARIEGALLVTLQEMEARAEEIAEAAAGREVVVFCHHGVRSLSAVELLRRAGVGARSMAGGIDAWSLRVDPAVPRY